MKNSQLKILTNNSIKHKTIFVVVYTTFFYILAMWDMHKHTTCVKKKGALGACMKNSQFEILTNTSIKRVFFKLLLYIPPFLCSSYVEHAKAYHVCKKELLELA